jgi:hypothetical protein
MNFVIFYIYSFIDMLIILTNILNENNKSFHFIEVSSLFPVFSFSPTNYRNNSTCCILNMGISWLRVSLSVEVYLGIDHTEHKTHILNFFNDFKDMNYLSTLQERYILRFYSNYLNRIYHCILQSEQS